MDFSVPSVFMLRALRGRGSIRGRHGIRVSLPLVALVAAGGAAAGPRDVPEPVWRADNELTLMATYRVSGSLALDDPAADTDGDGEPDIDAEIGETWAGALIYDLAWERNTQLEVYLARQRTDLRAETPFAGAPSLDLDIWHAHAGGTYLFEERGAVPYVVATAGLTHMDPVPAGLSSETRLSLRIGAGVKIPLARHLALRLEGSGIATFFDSSGGIFCSGGCVVRVESDALWQGEIGLGLSVGF